MNIKKYANNKFVLLFIIIAAIGFFIFTNEKSEKNENLNNMVEKVMEDKLVGDTSKNIRTVERSSDNISTQIGKQKLEVNSYYSVYGKIRKERERMLVDKENQVKENWISVKPKKMYQISVLLPHFEDEYWLAANYGIINYAKELGVKIKLYSVGGYIELGNQKKQLQLLEKDDKVDGIILASLDDKKFNSDVASIVNSGKPVVELVNDITEPKISAKSMVSYYDMGYKAGEAVIEDAAGKNIKIAFFPGPEGSGWASDTFYGFKNAISNLKKENQKIDISGPYYGDTRPKVQLLHVVSVLKKNNDYDYVVGCAPAVIEAEKFIAKNKKEFKNTKIVSTYITGEVYDLIDKGTVLASPSDQTIVQCRMSLDMIVRTLNGESPGIDFPIQSGPDILVICKKNISQFKYEDLFGTRDYIPVLNHISE